MTTTLVTATASTLSIKTDDPNAMMALWEALQQYIDNSVEAIEQDEEYAETCGCEPSEETKKERAQLNAAQQLKNQLDLTMSRC